MFEETKKTARLHMDRIGGIQMKVAATYYMFIYKFSKNHLNMEVKADHYQEALDIAIEASKNLEGTLQYHGNKPNKRRG